MSSEKEDSPGSRWCSWRTNYLRVAKWKPPNPLYKSTLYSWRWWSWTTKNPKTRPIYLQSSYSPLGLPEYNRHKQNPSPRERVHSGSLRYLHHLAITRGQNRSRNLGRTKGPIKAMWRVNPAGGIRILNWSDFRGSTFLHNNWCCILECSPSEWTSDLQTLACFCSSWVLWMASALIQPSCPCLIQDILA